MSFSGLACSGMRAYFYYARVEGNSMQRWLIWAKPKKNSPSGRADGEYPTITSGGGLRRVWWQRIERVWSKLHAGRSQCFRARFSGLEGRIHHAADPFGESLVAGQCCRRGVPAISRSEVNEDAVGIPFRLWRKNFLCHRFRFRHFVFLNDGVLFGILLRSVIAVRSISLAAGCTGSR